MKRTAAATMGQKQKKVKTDPVAKKVSIVSDALKAADMPTTAVELVRDLLPLSLGIAQDKRHSYQDKIVEMVGKELDKIEEGLRKAIDKAGADAETAGALKTSSEGTLTEATATMEKLRAILQEKKVQLADTTMGYRSARDALKATQEKERIGNAELDAATASKKELEELSKQIKTVHETKDQVPALIDGLRKHVEIVDSMLTAMPGALQKEPAARGTFDNMVTEQVQEQTDKRIAELFAMIVSSEPKREAFAAEVATAHAAFDVAREQLKVDADIFTQGQHNLDVAEAAAKAAQQALKANRAQARQDEKDADSAQAELDLFQEVREAFCELREAVTPAELPAGDAQDVSDETATTQMAGCAGA